MYNINLFFFFGPDTNGDSYLQTLYQFGRKIWWQSSAEFRQSVNVELNTKRNRDVFITIKLIEKF